MIRIEHYVISSICQYDDAATYAITKFKPTDFSIETRDAFKISTGLFKKHKSVDPHVFMSQLSELGYSEGDSLILYSYCLDTDDSWSNVFAEFKRSSIKRQIGSNIATLDELRQNNASIEDIASKTLEFSRTWITGKEKAFYTGKEVDELTENFGEPILTGLNIFDDCLYKYGGNRKGQMKGIICREKHGKTRSECWETAQNLKQGYKVLYLALEATKKEITENVKLVLGSSWINYRDNFYIVDGVNGLNDLESITIEAVLVEGVDKVVVDYAQLITVSDKLANENTQINTSIERFRSLMIQYNFHCVVLSQARKENLGVSVPKDAQGNDLLPKGYRFVPQLYDAYGSNALIKASSIVMIGFRPNRYEELIDVSSGRKGIVDPTSSLSAFNSFYIKIATTRYKPEFVHRWVHFVDGDNGLTLKKML